MKSLIFCLILICVLSLDNGLGRTPQMGWNSWNKFQCNINEALIKETVDLIVSTGLAAKGYRYVNLDDCWQIARDPNTKEIIPNMNKFPSGMASLGEYIHSKGLLYGLYSDAGFRTCAGFPGSLFYEEIDAATYAKWKVDYLKYDNCYDDGTSARIRYPKMRDALNATGRPIFFSMCSWGYENVWEWAAPVGNSWRTTVDIDSTYESMVSLIDLQRGLSKYSGPGAWNDPDMLEVGNGDMTNDEYQTHFAFWAALKAPLLIGCDLKDITKETLAILGNEEVIAVSQDPLGKQIDFIYEEKGVYDYREVWGGELSNNRYVLVCFNRYTLETVFNLDFNKLFPGKRVNSIRDVIEKQDVPTPSGATFKTKVIRSHAVGMFVISFAN